jgi:uncharacterized membrane protein
MLAHFKISRYFAVLAVIAALIPVHARAGQIGNPITVNGFTFINFDPSGTFVPSNANGISNRGLVVISGLDANGNSLNFIGTPARTTTLNTGAGAMAFGINSAGSVVGTQNGAAFFLPAGGALELLPSPAGAMAASGINDKGQIVGQFTSPNGQTPGFFLRSSKSTAVTINSPFEVNILSAQGINNFGLVVGYYVGPDGQQHGFTAQAYKAQKGVVVATAVPDPQIPSVPGEPGATFVFSQLLGVNDAGIAVGYYGDSTVSQHGFLYDTTTGAYTFLDNPSEAFSNGVEVTQITGISDSGELSGFYTDANGVTHSFTACPTYAFCPNFPNVLP